MTIAVHQELDVTVRAVAPVGCFVIIDGQVDGREGFVDQAKHPSWWTDAPPPRAGDRLHVVVLDASRNPPRLSALTSDIEIARRLRAREA
ncbi:hypothetical protein [Streptomyces sp. NPDC051214]|uniref:hypothetical protein n=1 Tax=Streptomyces sp. NPDC051214 TaxID=3155282 RepID=UPI003417840F